MKNLLKTDCESIKNQIKKTVKQPDLYLFLFLVGVFAFAFSTVKLEPLSDDGSYRTIIDEHPGFLNYLSFTYRFLNGRVIANTLMYVMLQLDCMPLWVLISTAAVVSIAYHLARAIGVRPSWKTMSLTLALISCIGIRVLSSSMLWFTGAIFYLWPIAVTVYLLSRLSERYHNGIPLTFGWRAGLELILSIFVALWGEQFALLLIGFWICYLASLAFQKKKKPSWTEILLISALVAGFCAMFFAPSQALKMTNIYGYAAYRGGVGYLLANGLCWSFQSVFIHQKIFVILFGVLILLCIDRSKNRVCVRVFEAMLGMSILFALMKVLPFAWCNVLTNSLYQIVYLPDVKYAISAWIPYLFWTAYTTLMLTLFLMHTRKKCFTGLILLASVATLVIMWFSTTMYASGNRTCALFCMGMVALMLKFLIEHEKNYIYAILGTGICNILFLIVPLLQQFVIYY